MRNVNKSNRFFRLRALIWIPALILNFYFPVHAQFEFAFSHELPDRLKSIDTIFLKLLNKNSIALKNDLDNLSMLASKYKDPQSSMFCELLRMRSIRSVDSVQLKLHVNKMINIIQLASEQGFEYIQIYGCVFLGDLFRENGHNGAAICYYLKANALLPQLDSRLLPKSYEGIEFDAYRACYDIGDFAKAKELLEQSKAIRNKDHSGMTAKDLLSQVCLGLGDYEGSKKNIEAALQIYLHSDTTNWWFKGWRGIFQGNLAKIHFIKEEYALAIPLLVNALKILSDAGMTKNVNTYGLLLANAYLRSGEDAKVKSLLPQLLPAIYASDDIQNHIDLYRLLIKMDSENPFFTKRSKLLDTLELWTRRLNEQNDRNELFKRELEFEITNYRRQEDSLKSKLHNQEVMRFSLLCMLGVLVVLAAVIIYRNDSKLKQQKQKTAEVKKQTDEALTSAESQLNDFRNALLEKTRQLELLESGLMQPISPQELEAFRANTILTDADWNNFKQLFEKAQPGYLNRLNQRFKNLTSGEIRFIVLIKLDFNIKEMSSSLGVSTGAIRTMKSRFLKKIDLKEEESLEKIISEI